MTNEVFTQHRLTWRFADEGTKQSSIFWLPKDKDPNQYISDILNIVELSASEYGYEYTLETVNGPEVIHNNKDLLGPIYRRKSDCGLCGLPVWAFIYENDNYYLSCGCGETDIRKKADFNRENFVYAETGEV